MSRFGARRRLAVAVLTGVSLLSGAATARSGGITLPRPGVICDDRSLTCYTADGPSLRETRFAFGSRAEEDLLRRLSGRPPAREFILSSGELCDLRERTCWDDGNRRRNVSNRLTQQLWGGAARPGQRTCQLSQRGRRLFSGPCRLTRRSDLNGMAYQIETGDGRRYDFNTGRDGRLVLRDATGTWPVSTANWGNRVEFRWADLQLETFRRQGEAGYGGGQGGSYGGAQGGGYGSGGYGEGGYGPGYRSAPAPTPTPVSPGQALDSLLNGLFQ